MDRNNVRKFGEPKRSPFFNLAQDVVDAYHTQDADRANEIYEEIRKKLSAREQIALSEEISKVRLARAQRDSSAKSKESDQQDLTNERDASSQLNEKHAMPRRTVGQRYILWGGIMMALLLVLLIVWGSIEDRKGEDEVRQRLTPIERAEFDWNMGHRPLALEEVKAIPSSSADYTKALSLIAQYSQAIEDDKPPNTHSAEELCNNTVKTTEEFPSTVSMDSFAEEPAVDRVRRTIQVEVDYTAKNSLGAELPYTVICTTDFDGNLLYKSPRTGR
ncbi:hypothetical protein [Acidobacterium sp. S8]|uniref:hypothetical protein n=1 Tax=Acidobacterium sp. S8 TaxID=1641854 RepID=UPI00131D12DA|nr:hypothetical protein [Acidobacterium sp. S8]